MQFLKDKKKEKNQIVSKIFHEIKIAEGSKITAYHSHKK